MDFAAIALIVAAILGSGGLSHILTLRATNRKTHSDAHKAERESHNIDIDALCDTVKALQGRIDQQDKKIAVLESALDAAKKRITELEALRTRYEQILMRKGIDPKTGKPYNTRRL